MRIAKCRPECAAGPRERDKERDKRRRRASVNLATLVLIERTILEVSMFTRFELALRFDLACL